jgi:hypothetical protein
MAIQMGQNLRDSTILADPALQFVEKAFTRNVGKKVRIVADVERDNFNPKRDKQLATLMAVVSVALVVLGVLAAILAHATGIGAAVGAVGLVIGLTAYYMRDKALEKEQNAKKVRGVHDDAIDLRIAREVQKSHDRALGVVPADNLDGNRMRRPVAVPRPQVQAAW